MVGCSAELYEAMRRVKRLFDPDNTMNDNLRDPALPAPPPLSTRLSFEVVGGMRGAADRCMNIGLCRKDGAGAMCPSYMATHAEEDSTRGRANALVHALSQPDPKAALGDDRLHEVLDLCLMCEACKSECPLGVDMAKLKSETLSHRHDRHGVPLRSRIFGGIRSLNRLGAATTPLSNLPGRLRPVRRLMERRLGITANRPLPRFQRRHLVACRILLHGHCHQKADVGTAATAALLRRIPGAEVVELDAAAAGWRARSGSRRSTTTCR